MVEDCAHVLGSKWRGKALGTHGLLGCYSTQTNKLINRSENQKIQRIQHLSSGEGGFLVTSNEKLMAKAVIHSGSYGHFHTVGQKVCKEICCLCHSTSPAPKTRS